MASAKQKLEDVLDRLEEFYGPVSHLVKSRDPVDQIVAQLVSEGTGRDRARRAYRRLRERFVDWNEARVALANEIRLALEPVGKGAKERAEVIHAFLHGLFARRHTMDLPYLAELSPEEAVAYLTAFSGVDAGAAALAICLVHEEPLLLPSTSIIRVAQRVGILPKGASGEKARASLQKLLGEDDRLRIHRLVMRLADEICTSRNFVCSRCPLVGMCRTGKKNAPGAEPPARAEPRVVEVVRAAPEKVPVPTEEPPVETESQETKATSKEAASADDIATTLTTDDDAAETPKAASGSSARKSASRKRTPAKKPKASKKRTPARRKAAPAKEKAAPKRKAAPRKKAPAKKKTPARKKAPARRKAAPKRKSAAGTKARKATRAKKGSRKK